MINAESYKIFSKIYCPILPAPLELFFGDGYRSEKENDDYCFFVQGINPHCMCIGMHCQ